MLILALDTSSPAGSLAVLRKDNLIASIGTASGEIYSSRVFRHLDFLLRETSLRLEDFELFAVAAGPGSFTGLRVGLTAVKGWAEVFGRPIAAVSALEAIAAQAPSRAANVVSVMDARRNELYWSFYRRETSGADARLVQENHEMVGSREEFVRAIANFEAANELAIATPDPDALAATMAQIPDFGDRARRVVVERVSPFLAPQIGRLGWMRAREGRLADSLTLDANYVRRSDAELHWKGSAGS